MPGVHVPDTERNAAPCPVCGGSRTTPEPASEWAQRLSAAALEAARDRSMGAYVSSNAVLGDREARASTTCGYCGGVGTIGGFALCSTSYHGDGQRVPATHAVVQGDVIDIQAGSGPPRYVVLLRPACEDCAARLAEHLPPGRVFRLVAP